MKLHSLKYSVFKYCILLLNVFFSTCARADTCNEHFKKGEVRICTIVDKDNSVEYAQNNSKVVLNCHSELYADYPTNQKAVTFLDCNFHHPRAPRTNHANLSTVLRNNTFGASCEITDVRLSGANIEIIEQNAFQCLTDITILFLSQNRIEVLPPSVFADMQNIYFLDLSFNRLRTLPDGIFHQLKELRVLRLNNNHLESLGNFALSNLAELSRVSLHNNELRSLENTFVHNPGLRYLEISNNNIASISEEVFARVENLEILELSGNRMQKITPEIFKVLRKLKNLDLSFNRIVELVDGPFRNNAEIEKLDLHGNNISEIKSGDLRGLLSLHVLNLGFNAIKDVAFDNFEPLSNLTYLNMESNLLSSLDSSGSYQNIFSNKRFRILNLSNNILKNISNVFNNTYVYTLKLSKNFGLSPSKNTFAGLMHLQILFMEECNITFLLVDLFENSPNLTEIYMRHNKIRTIQSEAFLSLKHINLLDLSNNKLEKLNDNLFTGNNSLRHLNVSHNNIAVIENGAFRWLNLTSWQLDASFNLLTELPSSDSTIRILNISHNHIKSLGGLTGNVSLTDLDVSYNHLSGISEEQWEKIIHLHNFAATNNYIEEITIPKIRDSKINCTVHLNDNKITKITLPEKTDREYENLFIDTISRRKIPHSSLKFHMRGNMMQCDCFAYKLFQYVNHSNYQNSYIRFIDDLVCHNPVGLRGRKLKYLQPADFTCNYNDDALHFQNVSDSACKKDCSCSFRPYDDFHIVNCSSRSHRKLPLNFPGQTNVLDMSHNNLKSIKELDGHLWEDLKEIHVVGNFIDSGDFQIPKNVTYLGLKDNRLSVLPISIQLQLEEKEDFKVTLSQNLWPCDCSILPMKYLLITHSSKVVDSDLVTCKFPDGSVSFLKTVSDNDLCACHHTTEKIVLLAVIITLIVLIFILLSVYCSEKKKVFLLAFYTYFNGYYKLFCRKKQIKEDKIYDGFIAPTAVDANVTLLPFWENSSRHL